MNREDYQPALIQCWLLAKMTEEIPTSEMLSLMSAADTIGPMLDPTMWMQKADAMAEDRKIVEAVAVLRAAFVKLKEAHPEFVALRQDL